MYRSNGILRVLKWFGILAGVGFALFPIFWMVSTSFKPIQEWSTYPPVWISRRPTLENYLALLNPAALKGTHSIDYKVAETAWRPLLNSLIISTSATVFSVGVGMLAALGVSRYKSGGESYPLFVLTVRMFPPIAVAVPMLVMYAFLHLTGTYLGLILAYTAFTLPLSIWMLRSFIDEVPREIEEAAVVYGLSSFQAFWRVTFPLIRGGLVATALFVYILSWSEFLFALSLTNGALTTVTVQVSNYFSASSGQLYGPQAALGTLSTIPVIFFGYLIQRHLVRGLTFGAIKR
jgi:multiple sugar transport system permease protein